MPGKKRKTGDWKSIAASRAQVPRYAPKGRGLSNIPSMQETGSAAYRRMVDKRK